MTPAVTRPPRPLLVPARHAVQRGFTLVEVLVALFIMAILAAMAWQGIDGLVRVREGASTNTEASLRLSSMMAQWELDLNQIQQSSAAPGLRFDGSALRLTRRTPDGIQIVVWTLQGNGFYRWASPPVTRIQDLQEWWLRSQQWTAMSADALKMLDNVSELQVYYYWNAWSNAQSTGDRAVVAPPTTPGTGNDGEPTAAAPQASEDLLPSGVRLVLSLPGGPLVRDLVIHPAS